MHNMLYMNCTCTSLTHTVTIQNTIQYCATNDDSCIAIDMFGINYLVQSKAIVKIFIKLITYSNKSYLELLTPLSLVHCIPVA